MLDSARKLAPAVIAFALAFAVTGTANARVADAPALTVGFSVMDDSARGPDVLNVGFHKKRFGHKRFGFRKFGYRGFGHHGFRYKHFGPRHGHGHVAKGPYFGKKGFIFKKRFGRRH